MLQVFFGGVTASAVQIVSDTQIIATAPAHAAGTVDVTIQSPYGTSVRVATDQFTYGGLTQTQRYVAQVYLDLLQRPVDPTGLEECSYFLTQGGSRFRLVQAIEASAEYRTLIVQSLYAQLLHRPADSFGLGNFVSFLGAGGTIEQVQVSLSGSQEYFVNRGNGTDVGFLNAVYHDALGRGVDAVSEPSWIQAMSSGMTPAQVAAVVFFSDEYRTDLIRSYYRRYLHRTADSSGLTNCLNYLRAGGRDQDLLAALVASDEYFARV
jgi:hypothetical protein